MIGYLLEASKIELRLEIRLTPQQHMTAEGEDKDLVTEWSAIYNVNNVVHQRSSWASMFSGLIT